MFRRKFLSIVLLVGMLASQAVPRVLAATYCDHAQFISDLTAPDGSSFAPSAIFTKTWRLMNIGTCTWTTAYSLVWVGGDSVGETRRNYVSYLKQLADRGLQVRPQP